MKYIESYKIFESDVNSTYSIHDFQRTLNSIVDVGKIGLDYNWGKRWSDHFIGDGIFDRVVGHCKSMQTLFDGIEWEYLKEVLETTMNDNLSISEVDIRPIYRYDHWYDVFGLTNRIKSGFLSANYPCCGTDKMICRILREIIRPTISMRSGSAKIAIRTTDEMKYVTNDLYKCVNFDPEKWFGNRISWTGIFRSYKTIFGRYDVEKLVDNFSPAAFISIGSQKHTPDVSIAYLKDLEDYLDEYISEVSDYIPVKNVVKDFRKKIGAVDYRGDKVPYYELILDLKL